MKRRRIRFWLLLFGGASLGLLALASSHLPKGARASAEVTSATEGQLASFESLVALQPDEIGQQDLLTLNLLCAQGLPGDPEISVAQASRTLDTWAKRVESETRRHLYRFREHSEDFNHSEAYFRILTLVTVLQQDFGVRYNPERILAPDFSDARDLFLPGLLAADPRGTCVSMPVLYVAVGRRLGYPLKLVAGKAHLFARWESADDGERFNIEATNQGLNCFPDEYYQTWPVPLSREEVARGDYLKSLSPTGELAVFLSTRGHFLEAAGRLPEAQVAYAHAHALAPESPVYLGFLAGAVKAELPQWERVRVDLGTKVQSK